MKRRPKRNPKLEPSGESPVVSRWLILLYQLPLKPSRLRVKTWRRLQRVGALQLKGSAYVLPSSAQAREDFEWIRAEVLSMNGEAWVFVTEAGAADLDLEIVARFQKMRSQDYAELQAEIDRSVAATKQKRAAARGHQRTADLIARLSQRWTDIESIDFFGAPGRSETRAALEQLGRSSVRTTRDALTQRKRGQPMPAKQRNRVWLTRPRPGVDRMSSAWLIQRFIDPKARFAFADKPKEHGKFVPFDMYGVEFGHQGDACTFETLARHYEITDPAVRHISKIVHDLDLKDDKFQVAEKSAVEALITGMQDMYANDQELLREGIKMFEALYQSMSKRPLV